MKWCTEYLIRSLFELKIDTLTLSWNFKYSFFHLTLKQQFALTVKPSGQQSRLWTFDFDR